MDWRERRTYFTKVNAFFLFSLNSWACTVIYTIVVHKIRGIHSINDMAVNLTQTIQVLISFCYVLSVIMNSDAALEFAIFNILSARSLQSQKVTTAMFSFQFYLQVVFSRMQS